MGPASQFSKMKRAVEVGGGDGCTTVQIVIPLNCALKSSSDGKFYIMHMLPQ